MMQNQCFSFTEMWHSDVYRALLLYLSADVTKFLLVISECLWDFKIIRQIWLCYVEVTYLLRVKTGSLPRSESDASIYCILTGNQGSTAQLYLNHSLSHQKPFCRDEVIHFYCVYIWESVRLVIFNCNLLTNFIYHIFFHALGIVCVCAWIIFVIKVKVNENTIMIIA